MKPREVNEGKGHGFLRANNCRSGCLVDTHTRRDSELPSCHEAITTSQDCLRHSSRTGPAPPGSQSLWSANVSNMVTITNDGARRAPPII